MRRHSVFVKLLLGNLLVVAVIISLGGFLAYRLLDQRLRTDEEQAQNHLVTAVERYFEQAVARGEPNIDAICKRLANEDFKDSQIRVTYVDFDGRVLGDSEGDFRAMKNHKTADRPELMDALDGRTGRDVRYSDTLKVDLSYAARPVTRDGKTVGAIRLAMPVKVAARQEHLLRVALAYSALAAVAVAVVLGLLISWIWYAPLRKISITARALAAGNLSARVITHTNDELGDLAKVLNEMRDGLAGQIRAVAAERENLQTVLANLGEGVIALDAGGRIVLMNRSAATLLGTGEGQTIGLDLQLIVRVPELADLYRQCLARGQSVSRSIEIHRDGHRRTLDVHAVPVPPGQSRAIQGLLVFRDVSDLARISAVKAEFVANASHELRTPLATIRAAVDSLATAVGETPEDITRLLGILDRHVQRLENMTNDLLDLHLVESGKVKLQIENVSLPAMADWCRAQFAAPAEEKGLEFSIEVSPENAAICCDRKLLELILRNLIDNAVKFTSAGGTVRGELRVKDKDLVVTVADTGCGIRPEDQPRIFERFFQADSSRSGDSRVRGTGLGLAIVRHSCERLGAKIALESALGKGTTVTVTVPNKTA